jgi:hypothetical protein
VENRRRDINSDPTHASAMDQRSGTSRSCGLLLIRVISNPHRTGPQEHKPLFELVDTWLKSLD